MVESHFILPRAKLGVLKKIVVLFFHHGQMCARIFLCAKVNSFLLGFFFHIRHTNRETKFYHWRVVSNTHLAIPNDIEGSVFNAISIRRELHVPQHHHCTQQQSSRVCFVLASDVWGCSMDLKGRRKGYHLDRHKIQGSYRSPEKKFHSFSIVFP